jgi:hypothetical protein
MYYSFDRFNRLETPTLILCKPNGEKIAVLGTAFDIEMDLKFNDISEIKFTVPYSINGEVTYKYNDIEQLKLIRVPNYGVFILDNVNIVGDGIKEVKECTALSLEAELLQRRISTFTGTYKFYDVSNTDKTLLGTLKEYFPTWNIGNVASSLWDKYRTFEITDQDIYSFLTSDVSSSYECIFQFDTFNRIINVLSLDEIGESTNILLTYDNLIKKVNIVPQTDQIKTCLNVSGGDNVDISSVNPNGTSKIYNFSYYMSEDWMSTELISALNSYITDYNNSQENYTSLLAQLMDYNNQMLILKNNGSTYSITDNNTSITLSPTLTSDSGLEQLKALATALEGIITARISGNLIYSDVNSILNSVNSMIVSKNTDINNLNTSITNVKNDLTTITDNLNLKNYLNEDLWIELNAFIREDSYNDTTFIFTDTMTDVDKQKVEQELYDYSVRQLIKLSQPRYTFEINSINFVALKEFSEFSDQLKLGSCITIKMRDDYIISPILLAIHLNFKDLTDFTLTYGNRTRLDDNTFDFGDALSQANKAGTTVSMKQLSWNNAVNTSNEVTMFMNSALDASKNAIVSSSDQEVVFNQNGIRLRKLNSSGEYEPEELWLASNMIAFSDDNFATAKMALGKISLGEGLGNAYGIVADAVVGKLVAGNNLTISNDNNSFKCDSTGTYLNNASFLISQGNNEIKIDASDGLVFTNDSNEVLKLDINTGSASFTGDITASNIEGSAIYSGNRTSGTYLSIDTSGNMKAYYENVLTYEFSATNRAGAIKLVDGDDTSNNIIIDSYFDYNNMDSQAIRCSKKLYIDSGSNFILTTGQATITVENGDITLNPGSGGTVNINGDLYVSGTIHNA